MHRGKRERDQERSAKAPASVATAITSVQRSSVCCAFDVDIDESNMNKWIVGFPKETFIPEYPDLYHDLESWAYHTKKPASVVLELTFPPQYPRVPPFARVVRPRFQFHTGHVTVGGSICTSILTSDGWRPDMSGEALLMMLQTTLMDGKGRVERHNPYDYTEKEAREAFMRVAKDHGWSV